MSTFDFQHRGCSTHIHLTTSSTLDKQFQTTQEEFSMSTCTIQSRGGWSTTVGNAKWKGGKAKHSPKSEPLPQSGGNDQLRIQPRPVTLSRPEKSCHRPEGTRMEWREKPQGGDHGVCWVVRSKVPARMGTQLRRHVILALPRVNAGPTPIRGTV